MMMMMSTRPSRRKGVSTLPTGSGARGGAAKGSSSAASSSSPSNGEKAELSELAALLDRTTRSRLRKFAEDELKLAGSAKMLVNLLRANILIAWPALSATESRRLLLILRGETPDQETAAPTDRRRRVVDERTASAEAEETKSHALAALEPLGRVPSESLDDATLIAGAPNDTLAEMLQKEFSQTKRETSALSADALRARLLERTTQASDKTCKSLRQWLFDAQTRDAQQRHMLHFARMGEISPDPRHNDIVGNVARQFPKGLGDIVTSYFSGDDEAMLAPIHATRARDLERKCMLSGDLRRCRLLFRAHFYRNIWPLTGRAVPLHAFDGLEGYQKTKDAEELDASEGKAALSTSPGARKVVVESGDDRHVRSREPKQEAKTSPQDAQQRRKPM